MFSWILECSPWTGNKRKVAYKKFLSDLTLLCMKVHTWLFHTLYIPLLAAHGKWKQSSTKTSINNLLKQNLINLCYPQSKRWSWCQGWANYSSGLSRPRAAAPQNNIPDPVLNLSGQTLQHGVEYYIRPALTNISGIGNGKRLSTSISEGLSTHFYTKFCLKHPDPIRAQYSNFL